MSGVSDGGAWPYYTWSASNARWEGFIPDLIAALCEELGATFVFPPAQVLGQDYEDLLEGRSQAALGLGVLYGEYGKQVSLERAYGSEG